MSVNNMRLHLKKAYSGKEWSKKVDKMSDAQVVASFHSMVARGKITV